MAPADLLEQIKQLSLTDRLVVIEAATRSIRDEINSSASSAKQSRAERLSAAALTLTDYYANDPDVTDWTTLDAEPFFDIKVTIGRSDSC